MESDCSPLKSLNPPGCEKTCSLFWHSWLRYSKVIMVDIQARSLGKIYTTAQIMSTARPLKPPNGCTYCLRDLLVLELLEVAMLVHAVHHKAVLGFHPALRHKVQLCVHIYSLHLSVIVVISGEALVRRDKTDRSHDTTSSITRTNRARLVFSPVLHGRRVRGKQDILNDARMALCVCILPRHTLKTQRPSATALNTPKAAPQHGRGRSTLTLMGSSRTMLTIPSPLAAK